MNDLKKQFYYYLVKELCFITYDYKYDDSSFNEKYNIIYWNDNEYVFNYRFEFSKEVVFNKNAFFFDLSLIDKNLNLHRKNGQFKLLNVYNNVIIFKDLSDLIFQFEKKLVSFVHYSSQIKTIK